MKFVSLFAGIGGFDLGLERAGMECVGQVEYNPFCQRVLKHHWPHVKLIGDIYDVTASDFRAVDLICGGFPCQPFSVAGKQGGTDDDRYLWPEMLRVIRDYNPSWVIAENVCGLLTLNGGMVFETVLSDLEKEGYEVQAFIIPACAVDAQHERKRVWIVAHSDRVRRRESSKQFDPSREPFFAPVREKSPFGFRPSSEDVADPESVGRRRGLCEDGQEQNWNIVTHGGADVSNPNRPGLGKRRRAESIQPEQCAVECTGENLWTVWEPEPDVGRVAHGVPGRVDRLRSLGNAVVPQVAEKIGKSIIAVEAKGKITYEN